MKTTISLSTPSQVETESLVAIVLDNTDANSASVPKNKDAKPQLAVETGDAGVKTPAADLLASGELSGKPFESNLLHKPAGLKAKRLLLISGGTAKKFTSYELRRIAGAAVRTLKARGIRSFAFPAQHSSGGRRARDCRGRAGRQLRSRLLPQRPQGSEDRCAHHSRQRQH
jgi:leucyl aminopeptidase